MVTKPGWYWHKSMSADRADWGTEKESYTLQPPLTQRRAKHTLERSWSPTLDSRCWNTRHSKAEDQTTSQACPVPFKKKKVKKKKHQGHLYKTWNTDPTEGKCRRDAWRSRHRQGLSEKGHQPLRNSPHTIQSSSAEETNTRVEQQARDEKKSYANQSSDRKLGSRIYILNSQRTNNHQAGEWIEQTVLKSTRG